MLCKVNLINSFQASFCKVVDSGQRWYPVKGRESVETEYTPTLIRREDKVAIWCSILTKLNWTSNWIWIHWIGLWEELRSSGRCRLLGSLARSKFVHKIKEVLPWRIRSEHRPFTRKLINLQQMILNSRWPRTIDCQLWAEIFHIKTGNQWRSTPPKSETCNNGCSKVAHRLTLSNESTPRNKRKSKSIFKIWNYQNIDMILKCSKHDKRVKERKWKAPIRAKRRLKLRKFLLELWWKKEFQMPF